MATTLESDLLTVAEAAALLKVSKVTISRWLKQGRLPAYRVGPRAVRIRRADLAGLVRPVSGPEGSRPEEDQPVPEAVPARDWAALPVDHELIASIRPMTEERRQALREAIESLDELRQQMLKRRGGRLFPDSAEEIREAREERSRQIDGW